MKLKRSAFVFIVSAFFLAVSLLFASGAASSVERAFAQDALPIEQAPKTTEQTEAVSSDPVVSDDSTEQDIQTSDASEPTQLPEESEKVSVSEGNGASEPAIADVLVEEGEEQPVSEEPGEEQAVPSISVLAHVQRQGWDADWTTNGSPAGTVGKSLRLEALRLRIENQGATGGSVQYRTHVQGEGWQRWVTGDEVSGSVGLGRRIEALQIRLTDDLAAKYDVWYRVHVAKIGWMAWTKNGESAGTAGHSLRAEAIQIVVVEKDGPAPVSEDQTRDVPFEGVEGLSVATHVQSIGWQEARGNGQVAGTTGRSLRLEAICASLCGVRVPGGVEVSSHVQGIGWMGWVGDGQVSGTTGQARRAEAFIMHLVGEAASVYDLYYRAHVQGMGWLAWAGEDQVAGSEGLSLRVEAIQTLLVPEGAEAPSNGDSAYALPCISALSIGTRALVGDEWQPYAWDGAVSGTTGMSTPVSGLSMVLSGENVESFGSVQYRVHAQNGDWQEWAADGGDNGVGSPIDAFHVQLSGPAERVYNVWYRAHVQSYGWMGWTCNGQLAGTTGMNKRLEAVQVVLVPKARQAPGATHGAYVDGTLRAGLDLATGDRSIVSFGGYGASGGVVGALSNAINDIQGSGYDVGFIMMDLASHKGVAYNCDAMFYGASSIKAPYIASVVSQYPDSVVRYAYDMTETLFYSWDYNYKNVLAAYGKGPMYTWCNEAEVRGAIADQLPWAIYSARELAKMWARNYQLFSQSSAGEQFGIWCERPNVSTIHSTLGGSYRTRSKAGWIDAGGNVSPDVNGGGRLYRVSDDGGIVYAHNGAYVVAIMSSVPDNHNMLNGLTAAIDAAHREM